MDQDSSDHPKRPGRRAGPARFRAGSRRWIRPPADIDPATAVAEEDDEARLPEVPEEPGDAVPEGPLAVGHAAIEQAVRLAPTSPGVYRMLNAANDVLYVGKAKNVRKRLASYARVSAVAAGPHPAHDRGHRHGRDRLHRDGNRGAAARSQSDQAVATALQRAAARRQIVSLYPDHRGPLGAADPQAPRRAIAARTLFRAVRLGRRRQSHHHGAAARLSGALLHRCVL